MNSYLDASRERRRGRCTQCKRYTDTVKIASSFFCIDEAACHEAWKPSSKPKPNGRTDRYWKPCRKCGKDLPEHIHERCPCEEAR